MIPVIVAVFAGFVAHKLLEGDKKDNVQINADSNGQNEQNIEVKDDNGTNNKE